HKMRAFTIIFAIAMSMAAMTCAAFLVRSSTLAELERWLDETGNYDLLFIDASEELLSRYQNDGRFSETGLLYRSGNVSVPDGMEAVYGGISSGAEGIFHFTLEDGRYPRKSGEIAAYRTFLEANGCAAKVGNTLTLELRDFDGNVRKTEEYTVVGVLWDQTGNIWNGGDGIIHRRLPALDDHRIFRGEYREDFTLPWVYMCEDELPEASVRDLMATAPSALKEVEAELNENGVDYITTYRVFWLNYKADSNINHDIAEEDVIDSLWNARKDRYSRWLMPVITVVIVLVGFVSISSVISTSLSERRRQFAMLRCIGMEKRRVLSMAFAETMALVVIGIAAGFVLGIGGYLLTLFIQKNFLGLHPYAAFKVHPVVKAANVNPYVLPAAASLLCSIPAVLVPYLIELRRSPVEGLSDKQKTFRKKGVRVKGKAAVLGKISGGFKQNIPLFIIVVAVMWSAVFGYAFFTEEVKSQTYHDRKALEERATSLDYNASIDYLNEDFGNAQINRHSRGITAEQALRLSECPDIEILYKAIEAKSTKAVYNADTVSDNIDSSLYTSGLHHDTDGMDEWVENSLRAQGYENEVLYNIPTLGVPEDTLEMLAEFLVEGSFNKDKLLSGEEILILRTERDSPYSVGDVIPMTDIVIGETEFEEFDFSQGKVPENAVPNFTYSFPEFPDVVWDGYAFGTRCDYTVTVGGIVKITNNERLSSFFKTDSLYGKCGFSILCAESAFERWGLPDRNYTKVGVKLVKKADTKAFEKLWMGIISESSGITQSSATMLKRRYNNIVATKMSVFGASIITVVILGLVGIVNSVNLRVRRGLRSYSTLRAIGLSKRGLVGLILRQGLIYAVIGAVTSLIPLGVFELVRIYAFEHRNTALPTDDEGYFLLTWKENFPCHVRIWEQPIFLIICGAFVAVSAVILISNIIPARWIAKKNITEAMRNDDF
ncbi:MAG: FtsX-like permease family protein, partial [Oscillospiraceae bacterium]|nr:FtsX-like permease family protein [Oscillospiraceae bacterium]